MDLPRFASYRWRFAGLAAIGLGLVGLYWFGFSAPFSLHEFCTRNRPIWILPLFQVPRYTAMTGHVFLAILAAASLAYLAAIKLANGLRGWPAAAVLIGLVPLAFAAVLLPGYPLLANDIFKYVFDGRILGVYGQNPFLHVPAEFPQDRFYDLVYWKAVVNAHGPLWRAAETGAALAGGNNCERSVLAMKVWPTLSYLATTAAVYAVLRSWQPDRALAGVLLYAWNPLVVLETVQNGHNDVVGALPAVGAVWLVARGRPGWGFPLLAVSALVKPLALVFLPPLFIVALRRSPWAGREIAFGLAGAGAIMVLAYLPFWAGPDTLQGLVRGDLFSASPAEALLLGLGLLGIPNDVGSRLAGGLANGLWLVALALLLIAAWAGRLSAPAATLGVVLSYLLIATQWFNPWYLLWLMPIAALDNDSRRRALAIAFSLLAPLVYVVGYAAVASTLLIFVPITVLAWWWRSTLGWSSRARPQEAAA